MKHIIFIVFIIINISCKSHSIKNKDVSTSDHLVAETVGNQIKLSNKEQIQWNKLIQDIEMFIYKQEKDILSKKQIGKTFFINASDSIKGSILEYEITYIGSIHIKRDNIRFLYITSYTGNYKDSQRANSVINLYKEDKRIGQYYVGGGFNALPQISDSNLIIKYGDEYCNQTTTTSFKDSIPKQIFIKCTKDGGDFYNFSKEV